MTEARANPLRQPKPERSERLLKLTVYFTDGRGKLVGATGATVILARQVLWLGAESAIPISAVESAEILERRGLIRKRYLQVTYRNPVTGLREAVCLAALDFLGFYRRKPLEKLVALLEQVRAAAPAAAPAQPEAPIDPAHARCEVCGARPAYYVPYVFQVAAIAVVYRSGTRRRVHCRRHNLRHGLLYWAVTAFAGWPAFVPSVLASYPTTVSAAARNLTPALGKDARLLAWVPIVTFLGFVGWGIFEIFR